MLNYIWYTNSISKINNEFSIIFFYFNISFKYRKKKNTLNYNNIFIFILNLYFLYIKRL